MDATKTPPPASECTNRPNCPCQFCTVTRFQPTEEDVLAEQFLRDYVKGENA
jgi:hypothetical protein